MNKEYTDSRNLSQTIFKNKAQNLAIDSLSMLTIKNIR
jgi:hypothetical protein